MSEYRKTIENLIRDILGDFPQGFNAGVVAGVPGWAGDMAYLAQEYPRALLTDTPLRPPVEYAGTTDSIAKAAGYEIPGTFSGQLGAAVGGLLSPGPGDLAKFAPLGAMFLGTKAATASQDALSLAKAMDAAGASRDEIWKATGELGQPWMKGPDGEWRFEIPDDAAGYAPGREFARAQEFANSHANTLEHAAILRSYMEKNGVSVGAAKEWFESEFGRAPLEWSGQLAKDTPAPELQKLLGDAETRIPQRSQWSSRLGNVLDHPELYAAYPDLVNVPFHIKPPIEMAGADGMFHGKGEISILDDAAYGLSKGKSITAHEAQHAVQDMEGFARGGTPKTMGDEMGNLYEFNQKFNRAFEQFLTSPDDVAKSNAQQEMDYYLERIRKLQDLRGVASPEEAYARLAGEAEARNVQSRMNMTMPERLATPPWKTLDVPEEQLIVRKGLLDGLLLNKKR